jgi:hypothetical protein
MFFLTLPKIVLSPARAVEVSRLVQDLIQDFATALAASALSVMLIIAMTFQATVF